MAADLFSLGDLYVSDFLSPGEEPRAEPFELRLMMNDDGLVHLAEQPPAKLMWGERYWYRSGTNQTMRRDLADVVVAVERAVDVGAGDVWVDIACNDGTLLSTVNAEYRIGVDPADDTIAAHATQRCEWLVREMFTPDVAQRIVSKHGRAKVVTCVAMFYDLIDPSEFLTGVDELLDDGVFVLQLAYAPLMLRQLAFDAICHEHARYYSLSTLMRVLGRADFRVVDATLNDVNGGSMRVFAVKVDNDLTHVGTQPWRDVGQYRVEALLEQESIDRVNSPEAWWKFWRDVKALREEVLLFFEDADRAGKTVWGYGASTKGNTLLQFFGLDSTMIDGIAERQERKVGLRTIGTNIPIHSEAAIREAKPDYALVLPWQFEGEILRRERDFLGRRRTTGVSVSDVPGHRMILVVDHAHSEVCGIHDLGQRIHDNLARACFDVAHADCDSAASYLGMCQLVDPVQVIVNYRQDLMPWIPHALGHKLDRAEIGVLHNFEAGNVDAHIRAMPVGFDRVLVLDPTVTPMDQRAIVADRPLPDSTPHLDHFDGVPWVGSFGFAFPHKRFDVVAAECATLHEAVFNLHMPEAFFNGANGARIYTDAILASCEAVIGDAALQFTDEHLVERELVARLARNDVNCLLYEPGQPDAGISSALDYLIAARRPILVSEASMFRHVHDRVAVYPRVRLADIFDDYETWQRRADDLYADTVGRFAQVFA